MSNRGKIRYVFSSSNTNQGFYTFIPELITGLQKVYILKGAVGSGKSTFIRLIGEAMSEQGYDVEFWISAADQITPDGVYIPQLQAAVVNGSLPQPIDPQYPAAWETIINLDDYRNRELTEGYRSVINEQVDEFQRYSDKASSTLKNAARIKEQIKKVISGHLNIEKMGKLTNDIAAAIMENPVREEHYFASAITPAGVINYINEISNDCQKRYILKGPPGSGKSTIINEIALRAKQQGHFMEYYHCGLNIESITMVIIRNLQLALVDAGEVEIAAKPWDIIIDMTSILDNYDINTVKIQIGESHRTFEALLLQAQTELEKASQAIKEIKKVYAAAMDFDLLDQKRQEVQDQISRGR